MGWFDDQIEERLQADDEVFSQAFLSMAGAVMGKGQREAMLSQRQITKNAMDDILKFYHVKPASLPIELSELNEQLEYLLRPSGLMRRTVRLEGEWYLDAVGAFLAKRKDGGMVALLPRGKGKYQFYDYERKKQVRLDKKSALLLEVEAICFYRPLPLKKLGIKDLLIFIAQLLSFGDYASVMAATLAVIGVGFLTPKLNNLLFSQVVASGSIRLFFGLGAMLVAVALATLLLTTMKGLVLDRLRMKLDSAVQAAAMMRVLSLPADFFQQYSAGELSGRSQSIRSLCTMLTDAIVSTGLTSLLSLVYVSQIFLYTPVLVVPSLLLTLATVIFSLITSLMQMKRAQRQMELEAKESGMTYALITGVQKLKLAGAEKRAFARWAKLYSQKAEMLYSPPLFIKLNTVISSAITMVGTLVLYCMAIGAQISVADYLAFQVSYGMVSGAFLALSGIAMTVANIRPIAEMVKSILETVPEVSEGKKVLTRIGGGIELSNVSFRYTPTMPYVVNELSLTILPGQYVALVGKTGCGKSTLMRLLLGFATPEKGSVYYDGQDINTVDLKSLRRHMGTVMQNGKLFAGDIYSNITVSAPWLTMEQAWEAAAMAGLDQDIQDMPMGMYTLISEGAGGISGGQRQRLMIARAVAPKPKILLFDEATSALDNITQKQVADSLAKLKCTRVVIAHRLSTIRECNRIIVLDQGKIQEDGTYEELVQKNGIFASLVSRELAPPGMG